MNMFFKQQQKKHLQQDNHIQQQQQQPQSQQLPDIQQFNNISQQAQQQQQYDSLQRQQNQSSIMQTIIQQNQLANQQNNSINPQQLQQQQLQQQQLQEQQRQKMNQSQSYLQSNKQRQTPIHQQSLEFQQPSPSDLSSTLNRNQQQQQQHQQQQQQYQQQQQQQSVQTPISPQQTINQQNRQHTDSPLQSQYETANQLPPVNPNGSIYQSRAHMMPSVLTLNHGLSSHRLASGSTLSLKRKNNDLECVVFLLDQSEFLRIFDMKTTTGAQLFNAACDYIQLAESEKDYFSLTYRDINEMKLWIQPERKLKDMLKAAPAVFYFEVKFYPAEPTQLRDEMTRYLVCQQIRQDIRTGRLRCTFATYSILGAYTAQSVFGDYQDQNENYLDAYEFAPTTSFELVKSIKDVHSKLAGLSPSQADIQYLENAQKLPLYGVDLHRATDTDSYQLLIGVSASGIQIYRDNTRINGFSWPKILKISYKRSYFYVHLRATEMQIEQTIGFRCQNQKAAYRLWKIACEHHTFFRTKSVKLEHSANYNSMSSLAANKFTYSGRTLHEIKQLPMDRPSVNFVRGISKKNLSKSLANSLAYGMNNQLSADELEEEERRLNFSKSTHVLNENVDGVKNDEGKNRKSRIDENKELYADIRKRNQSADPNLDHLKEEEEKEKNHGIFNIINPFKLKKESNRKKLGDTPNENQNQENNINFPNNQLDKTDGEFPYSKLQNAKIQPQFSLMDKLSQDGGLSPLATNNHFIPSTTINNIINTQVGPVSPLTPVTPSQQSQQQLINRTMNQDNFHQNNMTMGPNHNIDNKQLGIGGLNLPNLAHIDKSGNLTPNTNINTPPSNQLKTQNKLMNNLPFRNIYNDASLVSNGTNSPSTITNNQLFYDHQQNERNRKLKDEEYQQQQDRLGHHHQQQQDRLRQEQEKEEFIRKQQEEFERKEKEEELLRKEQEERRLYEEKQDYYRKLKEEEEALRLKQEKHLLEQQKQREYQELQEKRAKEEEERQRYLEEQKLKQEYEELEEKRKREEEERLRRTSHQEQVSYGSSSTNLGNRLNYVNASSFLQPKIKGENSPNSNGAVAPPPIPPRHFNDDNSVMDKRISAVLHLDNNEKVNSIEKNFIKMSTPVIDHQLMNKNDLNDQMLAAIRRVTKLPLDLSVSRINFTSIQEES